MGRKHRPSLKVSVTRATELATMSKGPRPGNAKSQNFGTLKSQRLGSPGSRSPGRGNSKSPRLGGPKTGSRGGGSTPGIGAGPSLGSRRLTTFALPVDLQDQLNARKRAKEAELTPAEISLLTKLFHSDGIVDPHQLKCAIQSTGVNITIDQAATFAASMDHAFRFNSQRHSLPLDKFLAICQLVKAQCTESAQTEDGMNVFTAMGGSETGCGLIANKLLVNECKRYGLEVNMNQLRKSDNAVSFVDVLDENFSLDEVIEILKTSNEKQPRDTTPSKVEPKVSEGSEASSQPMSTGSFMRKFLSMMNLGRNNQAKMNGTDAIEKLESNENDEIHTGALKAGLQHLLDDHQERVLKVYVEASNFMETVADNPPSRYEFTYTQETFSPTRETECDIQLGSSTRIPYVQSNHLDQKKRPSASQPPRDVERSISIDSQGSSAGLTSRTMSRGISMKTWSTVAQDGPSVPWASKVRNAVAGAQKAHSDNLQVRSEDVTGTETRTPDVHSTEEGISSLGQEMDRTQSCSSITFPNVLGCSVLDEVLKEANYLRSLDSNADMRPFRNQNDAEANDRSSRARSTSPIGDNGLNRSGQGTPTQRSKPGSPTQRSKSGTPTIDETLGISGKTSTISTASDKKAKLYSNDLPSNGEDVSEEEDPEEVGAMHQTSIHQTSMQTSMHVFFDKHQEHMGKGLRSAWLRCKKNTGKHHQSQSTMLEHKPKKTRKQRLTTSSNTYGVMYLSSPSLLMAVRKNKEMVIKAQQAQEAEAQKVRRKRLPTASFF